MSDSTAAPSGLRILYFGLPLGALLLRQDGHTIVRAVMGRKQAFGTRRVRRLFGSQNAPFGADPLEAAAGVGEYDLLVSWFYPRKLPVSLLRGGRYGAFGVHPSLLPRHRGPDPYFAALDQGDVATGVTAHRLEAEYDTGELLDQEVLPIEPSWNAWTLAKRLDRPSLQVLRRVALRFAQEGQLPGLAQNEARASAAPEPGDELLELDLASMGALALHRRVRAAAPWPGAFVFIDDECVVLERIALERGGPRLAPGELGCDGGQVWLGAADRAVRLIQVRLDGDEELGELPQQLRGAALLAWAEQLAVAAG